MICGPCCGSPRGPAQRCYPGLPHAAVLARAGYDGAKRKRASKLHLAVDTLGHLLTLHVTPVGTNDRAAVGRLAQAVQSSIGKRRSGLCRSGHHRPEGR